MRRATGWVLAAALAASGTNVAKAGFHSGGSWYDLTNSAKRFNDAETEAIERGGHLVTINDSDEQDALFGEYGDDGHLWIGLTDQTQERVWRWLSGEVLRSGDYTNWAGYEPNEGGNYGEDAAVMNWGYGPNSGPVKSAWNDLHVNDQHYGIIEVANVAPTAVISGSTAVTIGETVSFSAIANDANASFGDTFSLSWLIGGQFEFDGDAINSFDTNLLGGAGTYSLQLTAIDSTGASNAYNSSFNVTDPPAQASAVPEPASLALLGLGGLGLAGGSLRKRWKTAAA